MNKFNDRVTVAKLNAELYYLQKAEQLSSSQRDAVKKESVGQTLT